MVDYRRRDMSGYSEFFRDPNLVWAADYVLPEVARQFGRQLLVAEVGCSSGEETWSLAAQLAYRGVDFHITAIDESDFLINEARPGRYEFRQRDLMSNVEKNSVPDGCLDYFPGIRTNGWRDPVVVDESLKPHVTFMKHDVLASPLPTRAFDVVTACNFLYYFTPAGQSAAVGNMLAGLSPGDYFIRDNNQRNDPEWPPVAKEHSLVPAGGDHPWPTSIYRTPS
jgi:chemotaxis methyl-accepting protein methylase